MLERFTWMDPTEFAVRAIRLSRMRRDPKRGIARHVARDCSSHRTSPDLSIGHSRCNVALGGARH